MSQYPLFLLYKKTPLLSQSEKNLLFYGEFHNISDVLIVLRYLVVKLSFRDGSANYAYTLVKFENATRDYSSKKSSFLNGNGLKTWTKTWSKFKNQIKHGTLQNVNKLTKISSIWLIWYLENRSIKRILIMTSYVCGNYWQTNEDFNSRPGQDVLLGFLYTVVRFLW